jgi:hypothetical protein
LIRNRRITILFSRSDEVAGRIFIIRVNNIDEEVKVISENLRKTLQLAFATVAATLVHQQMKIANLENIMLSKGMAQEKDFVVAGLREDAKVDEMMNVYFPELAHLPDLFDNV